MDVEGSLETLSHPLRTVGGMSERVVDAVGELGAVDLATADHLVLRRALGLVREIEGWLAAVTSAAVRRGIELHTAGVGGDVATALQQEAGRSKAQARDDVARTAALDAAPAFAEALAAGRVSTAHVDTYRRAVQHSPVLAARADELAVAAARLSPAEFAGHCQRVAAVDEPEETADERFERQRRSTRLRSWLDRSTGMYRLAGEFDPATGEQLFAALDQRVEALFHDAHPATAPAEPMERQGHLRALALADLVLHRRPATGAARAQLIVIIDLETLLHGLHERSVVDLAHGGTLPVSEVRRLACEADIIPVVLGGDGVVLDMGRSRRLATADQRRAAMVMHPTCIVPSCAVPFHQTQMHHVDFWNRDEGTTDLGTQAPVCHGHHGDAHAGRLVITMDPVTRAVEVRDRHGTLLERADGPPGRRAQVAA